MRTVLMLMVSCGLANAQVRVALRGVNNGETVKFDKLTLFNIYQQYKKGPQKVMIMAFENDSITFSDSTKIARKDIFAISTPNKYFKTNQIFFVITGTILSIAGYQALKANEPGMFLFAGTFLGGIPCFLSLYHSINQKGRHHPEITYYMSEYELIKMIDQKNGNLKQQEEPKREPDLFDKRIR